MIGSSNILRVNTATKRMIWIFVTLIVGLIAMRAANTLRLVYPGLALAVAGYLYARSRATYVSFTCWIWFFSPLVRRLADFQVGFQEQSPILLAPYLVTAVCGLDLLTHARSLGRPRSIPFVLAFGAVAYGVVIGLTKYSIVQIAPAILNWLVPLCFAFFLVESHSDYDAIRRSFESTFLIGTLLMGVYGVYQFFFFPPWDLLWLKNMKTTAFGSAEPMEIRAFSTMNAPVIFGLTIMTTLLVVLCSKSSFRLIAGIFGCLGLTLSLERASWLGFVIGGLFVVWKMNARERRRIIIPAIIVCALSPIVSVVPEVRDVIEEKIKSTTNLDQDVSYQARIVGYQNAFALLAREPFGEGVGSPDIDHNKVDFDDTIGPHDSLFLELLYSLGWSGSALYLAGMGLITWRAFTHSATEDPFEISMKGVWVAFFAQCLLNDIVYGGVGVFFWSAGAVQLAAIAHAENESVAEVAQSWAAVESTQPVALQEEGGL